MEKYLKSKFGLRRVINKGCRERGGGREGETKEEWEREGGREGERESL